MASYNYGRSYDYDRGMSTRGERRSLQDEELNQRLLDANRRMENSSFRCVQVLNETVKMDVISHFPYSSPPSSVIEGLVL